MFIPITYFYFLTYKIERIIMNSFSGFPKNLAYSVKSLSSFSKISVKLNPDKTTGVSAGETIRVKMPPNALIDLRTLTEKNIPKLCMPRVLLPLLRVKYISLV